MKIAYFDCFSGISGDMCLGALVNAGIDFDVLRGELMKLPVDGYEIRSEKIKRNGISSTNIHVEVSEKEQPVRHLADVKQIIDNSLLPDDVKGKSKSVFERLALAEARVHDTSPEGIHFHEVGAVDAIIDVVGTVLGLSLLGVERVFASPLPMGRGFIKCMHGIIPAPAPATLELLNGIPVYGARVSGELVTPTGAALISTLAHGFLDFPTMTISKVGYGSGKRIMDHPNLLRLIIGEVYEVGILRPLHSISPFRGEQHSIDQTGEHPHGSPSENHHHGHEGHHHPHGHTHLRNHTEYGEDHKDSGHGDGGRDNRHHSHGNREETPGGEAETGPNPLIQMLARCVRAFRGSEPVNPGNLADKTEKGPLLVPSFPY